MFIFIKVIIFIKVMIRYFMFLTSTSLQGLILLELIQIKRKINCGCKNKKTLQEIFSDPSLIM